MTAPTSPEQRRAEHAISVASRLTPALQSLPELLGSPVQALAVVQAAKAEASTLWSELDNLERLLTARVCADRIVADVETALMGGER